MGDARTRRRRGDRRTERRATHSAGGTHGAARSHGELLGVHVQSGDGLSGPPSESARTSSTAPRRPRRRLPRGRRRRRRRALTSSRPSENATQLVMGASGRSVAELTRGSVINRVLAAPVRSTCTSSATTPTTSDDRPAPRLADQATPSDPEPPTPAHAGLDDRPRRRSVLTWCCYTCARISRCRRTWSSTCCCRRRRGHRRAAASRRRSPRPRRSLLVNWYFTPPFYAVHDHRDVERASPSSCSSPSRSSSVSSSASSCDDRPMRCVRGPKPRAALARVAGGSSANPTRSTRCSAHLRSTVRTRRQAAVLRRADGRRPTEADASSGSPVPTIPGGGTRTLRSSTTRNSCSSAPACPATTDECSRRSSAQLDSARERPSVSRGRRRPPRAALAEADFLRTAVAAAPSRTIFVPRCRRSRPRPRACSNPMSSGPQDDRQDFLHTIDEETDRLNRWSATCST